MEEKTFILHIIFKTSLTDMKTIPDMFILTIKSIKAFL
ncbi:hypothetical protein bcere0017_53090 [Bacillus cereus Rock1-3]|nr:hypothetical protein bcere0017_53090 [Bacillus cereus Rock1-3]